MIETTTTTRTGNEDCRFCYCGELAVMAVTDARQVDGEWYESDPRYGCAAHPVASVIYFSDGNAVLLSFA